MGIEIIFGFMNYEQDMYGVRFYPSACGLRLHVAHCAQTWNPRLRVQTNED